ncbi:hypothetical protein SESBI_05734 [Sesbania bispinosa]|nr:hypothetical protein SESBI_05734 [Sesbania bispinosa]
MTKGVKVSSCGSGGGVFWVALVIERVSSSSDNGEWCRIVKVKVPNNNKYGGC